MALGTFETVGHHTFEDRQNNCADSAPYHCDSKSAFLGNGMYFWEDNLEMAKYWGGHRYINQSKQYMVGEFDIKCERELFFDLVGVRAHQKFLKHAIRQLSGQNPKTSNWPIGKVIEFLKAANRADGTAFHNQFPYKLIRAADHSFGKMCLQVAFSKTQPNVAELNPCYIICAIDKNSIVLGSILVAHSSRK